MTKTKSKTKTNFDCPMSEEMRRSQRLDSELNKYKKFAKEYLDIELQPYQLEFLKKGAKFRQFGKTTAKLVEAITKAQTMTPHSYLVYVTTSPNEKRAAVDTVVHMLKKAKHSPKYYSKNNGLVILENDVKIRFVYIKESKIRGVMADVIIHEAVYDMNIKSRRGMTIDRDRYIFDTDQMF